jgi:exosortase
LATQVTIEVPKRDTRDLVQFTGWAVLFALAVLLWLPELGALWPYWHTDPSLSHGLFVPVLAAGLLWYRRDALRGWRAASVPGLCAFVLTATIYMGAVWADIDFLKPLSLIAAAACAVWFLGGREKLYAVAGPLGVLPFMIPWPTVLVERLGFPLQLASSSYAALFAGLLGTPIYREGVQLFVMPSPDARPIYSIIVAQQCSGLTSLAVLLLLGYLVAYWTPVKLGWRFLLVAAVPPLALLANATRLTVILLAGAHGSPGLAKWVHDHEGPVLIFFCSVSLMGLRHGLLSYLESRSNREDDDGGPLPAADTECALIADPPG